MKAPNVTEGEWTLGDENNEHAEIVLNDEHGLTACFDRADRWTGKLVISREEMLANVHMCMASKKLAKALLPFARFACDEPHVDEDECPNCIARAALKAAGYTEN